MSKITNDGLTLYGTGCFIAIPIWQQCRRQKIKIRSLAIAKVEHFCTTVELLVTREYLPKSISTPKAKSRSSSVSIGECQNVKEQ